MVTKVLWSFPPPSVGHLGHCLSPRAPTCYCCAGKGGAENAVRGLSIIQSKTLVWFLTFETQDIHLLLQCWCAPSCFEAGKKRQDMLPTSTQHESEQDLQTNPQLKSRVPGQEAKNC